MDTATYLFLLPVVLSLVVSVPVLAVWIGTLVRYAAEAKVLAMVEQERKAASTVQMHVAQEVVPWSDPSKTVLGTLKVADVLANLRLGSR